MALTEYAESDSSNMMHGEHIITRLTYISRYNSNNPNGEVSRILEQAQQNNARNGITGALIFNHNYFLQSIEGARPLINDLLRKLVKDERHFSLQVIECTEIEQRRWDKWSMKYLIPSEENKEHSLKYSAGTSFNPYLMSTPQIMMMIDTLTKQREQEEAGQGAGQVMQISTSQIKELIDSLSKQSGELIEKKKSWFSFS